MYLEPHFLGVAPRGSRHNCFAVLKSGLKEVFRHNCETSRYGNEPLSSHKFAMKLPRQSGMFSGELRVQALCSQSSSYPVIAVTEMHQVGCCFTKAVMLVLRNVGSALSPICAVLGGQRVQSDLTRHLQQRRFLYRLFSRSLLLRVT